MAFADLGGDGGGSSSISSQRTVPDIYEPGQPEDSVWEEATLNGGAAGGNNPLIKVNSEEANMNDTNSPRTDPSKELVFLPRAVSRDLLQSELAVMSGGIDKNGNYVIVFPTKRHSMLSTQYAFADHLQVLINFLIDLTLVAGFPENQRTKQIIDASPPPVSTEETSVENVSTPKFVFVVDQKTLNHAAISVIIRSLSNIQRDRKCVEMLYVSRPKEKKEFKTLQKLLGLGKIKSGEPPMPKLNFQAVLLNDARDVQKYIDPANLPKVQGGYYPYRHEDFVDFIFRLESLREVSNNSFNRYDQVFEEALEFEQSLKTSLCGLKRSCKLTNARFESLRKQLDLDALLEECDAFHDDLLNPEKEQVYAQIPKSILAPSTIREIEFHRETFHRMKNKLGAVWKNVNKSLSSSSSHQSSSNSQQSPQELKNENKSCGIELLTWFKIVGPESLEESKKKVEDSANISENIKTFHSTVVPFIEEAVEVATEWVQCADQSSDVESELATEIKKELEPFKKEFAAVRKLYQGCQSFYDNVKKVMDWYQQTLAQTPEPLLDKDGRPDGKWTRVFLELNQNHIDDIIILQQEVEPLDPQAIETVENTMLYIQDMSLRNQSKILLQRCKVLEKLIDIYSQPPEIARQEILSKRCNVKGQSGSNSLPPTLPRGGRDRDSQSRFSIDGESGLYEQLGDASPSAAASELNSNEDIRPAVPPRAPFVNHHNPRFQNGRRFARPNQLRLNSKTLNGNVVHQSISAGSLGRSVHYPNHRFYGPSPSRSPGSPLVAASNRSPSRVLVSKTAPNLSVNGGPPKPLSTAGPSSSYTMNFSSSPEQMNYSGNVGRFSSGPEHKRIPGGSLNPGTRDNYFSTTSVKSPAQKEVSLAPEGQAGYSNMSLGRLTPQTGFYDPSSNRGRDKQKELSRAEFYSMKDYPAPIVNSRHESEKQKRIGEFLSKQPKLRSYLDETSDLEVDQRGGSQRRPQIFDPIDPWDDVECLRNRKLLHGLTKQLVSETMNRVDDESELERERERILRLGIFEEEVRQIDIKKKLQRAQRLIEAKQAQLRAKQVEEELKLFENDQQKHDESSQNPEEGTENNQTEDRGTEENEGAVSEGAEGSQSQEQQQQLSEKESRYENEEERDPVEAPEEDDEQENTALRDGGTDADATEEANPEEGDNPENPDPNDGEEETAEAANE